MKTEVTVTTKNFWDLIISALTLFGAVLGAGFAVEQYLDSRHKDRIEHTLGFLSRFNDTPLADRRYELEAAWDNVNSTIGDEKHRTLPSRAQYGLYETLIVHKWASSTQVAIAIATLLEFYGQVAKCVKEKLCDEAVARETFAGSATAFLHNFTPYICNERRKWNDPLFAREQVEFWLEPSTPDKSNAPDQLNRPCSPWRLRQPVFLAPTAPIPGDDAPPVAVDAPR